MKHYNLITTCTLIFALFIGTTVSAKMNPEYTTTDRDKTVERSFQVDKDHQLKISNRYGKVELINWDRSEIKVTVRVSVTEQSAQRAAAALDRVTISESHQGKVIDFETKIDTAPSSWWSAITGSSQNSLSIDYQVYLPKSNRITILNRYGSIIVGDRDGATTLSIGYGSLTTGRLMGSANTLNISYSQAKIAALSTASASVKYSKFELGRADRLKLTQSYSSGTKIGEITREIDASMSYSASFQMGLGATVSKASIKASYSGVQINSSPGSKFDFNAAIRYGQFNYDKNKAKISKQASTNTSKSFSGSWNGDSNNYLSIQSSYGNVSLN